MRIGGNPGRCADKIWVIGLERIEKTVNRPDANQIQSKNHTIYQYKDMILSKSFIILSS